MAPLAPYSTIFYFFLKIFTLVLAVTGPAQAQVPGLIASLLGFTGEFGNAMNLAPYFHASDMLVESPTRSCFLLHFSSALAWSVLDLVPGCAETARTQVKAADMAAGLAADA